MRLKASLPNGVRLELEDADAQALSVMIEVLGRERRKSNRQLLGHLLCRAVDCYVMFLRPIAKASRF